MSSNPESGCRWQSKAVARRALALLATVVLLALPLAADYDPAVPSPESVLGYSLGVRVTDYHGMERYLSTLADASPRVVYGSYGSDYEGRTLRYAVVSSEDNIARLESVRAATARLSDPRDLTADETAALIEATPAVVWLNYGTDGNETAGLESALLMAWHLAADTGSQTAKMLRETVVVITPVMNPSSHERWASWSNSFAAAPLGNPDPLAMEHNPPWGVLTNNNHYLVDLNRESVWATQRESAALRDFYYQWNPAVFVDHHGEYDEFTGPGYEEPLNPLFTGGQRRWLDRFGRSIGRRFAGRGWSYSPWETGTFYPGFWESFGLLNGAVGFTYETIGGGSKGLRYRREDGSVITLELASRQHYEASLAVLEASAKGRRELLTDYLDFRISALELAKQGEERAFIVEPGSDPARAALVLEILLANRVEVYRASSPFRARGVHDYFGKRSSERDFPAGVYVIPAAQPQARLLLTLMRKDLRLPEVTLEAAETFRAKQEKAGYYNPKIGRTTYLFYDVTAWSLPLTHGVAAHWTEVPPTAGLERVESIVGAATASSLPKARYGYAFSGDQLGAAPLLVELLQQELVVNVAYDDFSIEGRSFPRGSVLIRSERNSDVDLPKVLAESAGRFGVEIRAIDSTYADEGPSVGSDRFAYVRRPKVAVLAGDPVSTRSFGDLWFVLEQLVGLEFTAIYRQELDDKALAGYDVLVLPDGYYDSDTFSAEWTAALKSWIRRGGTLVCLARASRWASDPELELAATRMRPTKWPLEESEGVEPRKTQGIPGAILRAQADPHHYLTQGYSGEVAVLVDSNLAFEPDPMLAAPVTFAGKKAIHLAGFAYPDSLERLAETPYLVDERLGSGHVVLFLDDPNFRIYWRGLTRLFLNSILLSPSL